MSGPSSLTDGQFAITFTSSLRMTVKIPEVILSRCRQGNINYTYVVMSCGVRPNLIWGVQLEGRKLTEGWKRFVEDNYFEVGDRLVFDYQGYWMFHVERYRENRGNTQDDEAPMGDEERFVTVRVTTDKLERERMYLPQSFCEANALYNFAGMDIFMAGEDDTKFHVTLKLECFPKVQRLRLGNGLREFLESNDITVNDEIRFEILWVDISAPTLKLRSKVIVV